MSNRSHPPGAQASRRTTSRRGIAGGLLQSLTSHARVAAAALTTVGLVAAGATVAVAEVTTPNPQTLKAVGPVSAAHGFPVWYEDSNGLRLEQCLDTSDPYCDPAFLMGEMPNGLEPISFPGNWPMESFYHQVGTVVDAPSGGLGYVAALEATFANEAVQDGDQVVFGRVRFDLDLPGGGTYKVTHPYGVDTFTVSDADADGFRYVEDITPAPGNFALALKSRVNPFLVREGGIITAPNGNKYIGDPAEQTRVTGSPLGTNLFKVEQLNADGTIAAVIGETDLFNLMGKVSTNSGVNAGKVILNETSAGKFLDVFATTDAGDVLTVEGAGIDKTTLSDESGRYFARIPLTGAEIPSTVKITNESDVPLASKTITVTDDVVVSGAVYDTDTDLLTVSAASTDQVEPPALTLDGLTTPEGGAVTVGAEGTAQVSLQSPPANVKVSSAAGGTGSAAVTVTGGAAAAPTPTSAIAVATPSQVNMGEPVTLDGSSSQNAATYAWAQTGGETVALTDADKVMASFTAPMTPGELTFTLTVTDDKSQQVTSAPLVVTVVDPATQPPPTEEPPVSTAPVADATASTESAMAGQSVTISAADNPNNASLEWAEPSGRVTIADPAAKSFTFAMPNTTEPLTFNLTVTGTDGTSTATDSVTVTPINDTLTVASAQYRGDKREWRIEGTASITTVNQVSVYLQKADGTKGALIGTAVVSPPVAPATTGEWGLRVRSGPAPATGDTLWVESTRGGLLKGVTFSSR
jgi:hypothetical protein